MNQEQNNQEVTPTLAEVKAILREKGLRPVDWKHLNEVQMRYLAGVK